MKIWSLRGSRVQWVRSWVEAALGFVAALALASCGSMGKSMSSAQQHEIHLKQNAWVMKTNGDRNLRPKDTVVIVKDEPVLFESPGYVSVLVIPPGGGTARSDLQLRTMGEWTSKMAQQYSNRILTTLLSRVREVQVSLGQNRGSEALDRVRKLRAEYPEVAYLGFLEASALMVLGRRSDAKGVLESALQYYPDHPEARVLYKTLAGREFVPTFQPIQASPTRDPAETESEGGEE